MGSQAFTKLQFGIEATNGTAVAADTILPAMHPPISPDRVPTFPEENIGVRANSMRSWIGQFQAQETITIENAYFEALPALLQCGIKGNVTGTTDANGLFTYDLTPSMSATNSVESMTLELGDDEQAWEAEYLMFERYNFSGTVNQGADASPVTVEADYFARQYTKTSFTSLSLASDLPGAVSSLTEMNAKQMKFYVDSDWASVGSTEKKMLRGFEVEVLTGLHPKHYATSDQFFAEHGESVFAAMATVTLEGTSDAVDVYDQFTGNGLQVWRFAFENGNHQFLLDVGGFVESVTPISESDQGNNLWQAVLHGTYDPTGAKLFDMSVTTAVQAI